MLPWWGERVWRLRPPKAGPQAPAPHSAAWAGLQRAPLLLSARPGVPGAGGPSPGSVEWWPGGQASSSPGRSAVPPAWRQPAADPAPLWGYRDAGWTVRPREGPPPHQPRASPPRRLWFSTSRLAIRVTSSLWSPLGPLEAPGPELCKAEGGGAQSFACPLGSPVHSCAEAEPRAQPRGKPCELQAKVAPQPSGNSAQEARGSGSPNTEAAKSCCRLWGWREEAKDSQLQGRPDPGQGNQAAQP